LCLIFVTIFAAAIAVRAVAAANTVAAGKDPPKIRLVAGSGAH
jgi:hypothetical protein